MAQTALGDIVLKLVANIMKTEKKAPITNLREKKIKIQKKKCSEEYEEKKGNE